MNISTAVAVCKVKRKNRKICMQMNLQIKLMIFFFFSIYRIYVSNIYIYVCVKNNGKEYTMRDEF